MINYINLLYIVLLGYIICAVIMYRYKPIGVYVFLGYSARLAQIFLDKMASVIPYTRDYKQFDDKMTIVYNSWSSGQLIPESFSFASVDLYSFAVAPFNYMTGGLIGVSVVNSIIAVLATLQLYKLAKILVGTNNAKKAALFFILFPSYVHYSAIPMRDSMAIFFMVSFILYSVSLACQKSISPIKLALSTLGAIAIRPENLIIVGPVSVYSIYIYVFGKGGARTQKILYTVTATGVIASIVYLYLGTFAMEVGYLSPEAIELKRSHYARSSGVTGKTFAGGYLGAVSFNTWQDVLLFIPKGAIYFVGVPFPWMVNIKNPFMIFALIENVFILYPMIYYAALNVYDKKLVNKGTKVVLLCLVTGSAAYGLIEGNMGPAMRHRLQITFGIFVLSAPYMPRIKFTK